MLDREAKTSIKFLDCVLHPYKLLSAEYEHQGRIVV